MSDSAALKRQLTIKTGVVKRLVKEEKSYVTEAQEQEARVAKFQQEGKDDWEIKKQQEVLRDCQQMIPDCRKRLQNAVEDLRGILDSLDGDSAESAEVKAAREAVEAAQADTQ